MRNIEKIATNPNIPKRRAIGLFNNESWSRDIKYRKLVKKIKNYNRDWWKGDMERTIRKLETEVIIIGGV